MQPDRNSVPMQPEVKNQKTKMCKFFAARMCTRGDQCSFAHHEDDLRSVPDYYRTRFCRTLQISGHCSQLNCSFAHGMEELRTSSCTGGGAEQRRSQAGHQDRVARVRQTGTGFSASMGVPIHPGPIPSNMDPRQSPTTFPHQTSGYRGVSFAGRSAGHGRNSGFPPSQNSFASPTSLDALREEILRLAPLMGLKLAPVPRVIVQESGPLDASNCTSSAQATEAREQDAGTAGTSSDFFDPQLAGTRFDRDLGGIEADMLPPLSEPWKVNTYDSLAPFDDLPIAPMHRQPRSMPWKVHHTMESLPGGMSQSDEDSGESEVDKLSRHSEVSDLFADGDGVGEVEVEPQDGTREADEVELPSLGSSFRSRIGPASGWLLSSLGEDGNGGMTVTVRNTFLDYAPPQPKVSSLKAHTYNDLPGLK
mmetsp:Transcript_63484/g.182243  ORF Transcript_63484/g.182243 Transcript_63484/m.182243 type:complete len:421 (+) Transcript_63484:141-1403(+)